MTSIRSCGLVLASVASILLSLLIGFYSQASSPNYGALFLSILPFALLNAALVRLLRRQLGRETWIVGLPALVGFSSFIELALRVIEH